MDGFKGEMVGSWTESCLSGGDSGQRVGDWKREKLRVNGGDNVRIWSVDRKLDRFLAFKVNLFGE